MTGGLGIQNSLAQRRSAEVVVAAAQRLCKVRFEPRFMVAVAASPKSHEGPGRNRRWKVGWRSSNDVAQVAKQGEDRRGVDVR